MQREKQSKIMGSRAIIILFLAVTSGILAGCGREKPRETSRTQQESPLPVERIVAVKRQADASGTVVLSVPKEAVFHQGELAGVYVVGSDGRISIRWVRIGRTSGEDQVILGGLEAGEDVVASRNRALREGVRVKQQVPVTKEVQSYE